MEEDLSRANEVWVGLGDVEVVGWREEEDGVLRVVVCLRGRPVCGGCGGGVWAKETREVVLADLPVFEAPVRLVWRKRRWQCPSSECEVAFVHRAGGADRSCAVAGDQPGGAVGDRAGGEAGSDGG